MKTAEVTVKRRIPIPLDIGVDMAIAGDDSELSITLMFDAEISAESQAIIREVLYVTDDGDVAVDGKALRMVFHGSPLSLTHRTRTLWDIIGDAHRMDVFRLGILAAQKLLPVVKETKDNGRE